MLYLFDLGEIFCMGCRAVGVAVGLNLHPKNRILLASNKIKVYSGPDLRFRAFIYHKSGFYITSPTSISCCRPSISYFRLLYHIVGLYIKSRAPKFHNSEPYIILQRPTKVSADTCQEENIPSPTSESILLPRRGWVQD